MAPGGVHFEKEVGAVPRRGAGREGAGAAGKSCRSPQPACSGLSLADADLSPALAGTASIGGLASGEEHAWQTCAQLPALVLLSLWPGKVVGVSFLTGSGTPEKPQSPGLPKSVWLLGRGWRVGGASGAGFYLPPRELGDSPKAAQPLSTCRLPARTQGSGVPTTRSVGATGAPF